MLRPRGCLIGIGGILLSLVLCCVLAYFIALPRFHQQVENELADLMSTEVAGILDQDIGALGNIGAGEHRIPLDSLESRISGGSQNLQTEGITLRGEGNELVLGFSVSNASTEYRFTPTVSPEGYLEMTDMRGDGGIVERILSPESIGSAVERAVNDYLQANGLYLEDVAIAEGDLVLVTGER